MNTHIRRSVFQGFAVLTAAVLLSAFNVAVAQPMLAFKAKVWLAETEEILRDTTMDFEVQRQRTLTQARTLDEVVGWTALCADDDAEHGGPLANGTDPWTIVDSLSFGFGLLSIEPFAETEHLVHVMCYTGAYQGSGALVHLAENGARLVRFEPDGDDGEPEVDLFTGYIFGDQRHGDPALPTRRFVSRTVYRGLGDCGSHAVYRLGEESIASLMEMREKAECEGPTEICDGNPCVDPEQWPLVYSRD